MRQFSRTKLYQGAQIQPEIKPLEVTYMNNDGGEILEKM